MIRLADRALEVALGERGVMETSPNAGPRVNEYLAAAGLPPGQSWCLAFVQWAFKKAAHELGVPLPKGWKVTGHVATFWEAMAPLYGVARPTRGGIFCHDSGAGHGHTGFCLEDLGSRFHTWEGNTGPEGQRNGDRVLGHGRPISYASFGFLDFSRPSA